MRRALSFLLIALIFNGLGYAKQMILDEASSVGIVHVLCNAAFERLGFNVTNASVGPNGTHVFTVMTKDGAATYVMRGQATLSFVKPLYSISAQAARLDVELSDDTERTKLWIVLKVEESRDGKTLYFRWTATFMREGVIPLNGYLVENEVISIKEGDVTLTALSSYLLEAPPGAVVRIERKRLTAIGNEKYRSLTAEYYKKVSPEELLVKIETWLAMPSQGMIVSGEDTFSFRLDSGSVDLLDSTIKFVFIVFDKDSFEIEIPILEYKLVEKKRTLSTAVDGVVKSETTLVYAATNPQYGMFKFKEEIAARIMEHTFYATTSWAFHVNGEAVPAECFSLAVDPLFAAIAVFAVSFVVSELVTNHVACCENCPVLQTKEGSTEDIVCEIGVSTVVGLGVSGAAKTIATKVGYKGSLSVTKVVGGKVASWLGKQRLTRQAAESLRKTIEWFPKAAVELGKQAIKKVGEHSEFLKDFGSELVQSTVTYLVKRLIPKATPKRVRRKYIQVLTDQPGFNEYRWFNQDFSWVHTLPSDISPANLDAVELAIEAWDVDSGPYPYYEFDRVYLDGKYLGDLQGKNEQWSTTVFTVRGRDSRWIFSDGEGVVELDIDSTHDRYTWAVTIRKSTMTFYYWEKIED